MLKNISLKTLLITLLSVLSIGTGCAGDFTDNPQVQQFIDEMVKSHDFDRQQLETLFAQAKKRDDILKAISRPAESKAWYEYRPIFLQPKRIQGGVEFWKQNAELLAKTEKEFGVDAAVIVAIIGVETRYGANTGSYRVIDALSTLAFDYPPRSKFFRSELEQFLILSKEEQVDPASAKGSYAGAMGYGQFIPSSYRHYAVDFDKDGKRDLWDSLEDIIGSVANYFHQHHWKPGEPVASKVISDKPVPESLISKSLKPAEKASHFFAAGIDVSPPLPADMPAALLKLEQRDGPEYWLVSHNFYVITRYNRSPLYAMAVFQLSEAIRDAYQKN